MLQWLALEGLGFVGLGDTGEGAGGSAFLAVIIGTTLALLGLVLVQAATACALDELDEGREITALDAYARTLTDFPALLRTIGLFVAVWVALTATTILIPVAIWLAVRWSLLAPVVELEDLSGRAALRRSRRARARSLVADGLARRAERVHLARRRPAARRAPHLRRRRTARDAQPRRGHRVRRSPCRSSGS